MNIELEAAASLRHLALNEDVKAYILQNPPIYQSLLHAAMRFIGGETLDQCVEVAEALNKAGFAVTIDYMGESTRDEVEAEQATQEFCEVIRVISSHNLDASVSLDLSHIGAVVDPEIGYRNACILAGLMQKTDLEMMISMEGTDRTDLILEIYQRLCENFNNVGITLQAYLHRTPDDLESTLRHPGKIRLVKGAYAAPADLAKSCGVELDAAYSQLMEVLFRSEHLCSISTHDPNLLEQAHKFIQEHQIEHSKFEFEMLKGVAPERLKAM
jgi:proline dehydrogenase